MVPTVKPTKFTHELKIILDFFSKEKAKALKMPFYLIHIWDLAILALQSNQPKIY